MKKISYPPLVFWYRKYRKIVIVTNFQIKHTEEASRWLKIAELISSSRNVMILGAYYIGIPNIQNHDKTDQNYDFD